MSISTAELPIDDPVDRGDNSVKSALRSPKRLRIEILAGLAVAFALIPEAISFAILAGVDPKVGLYASFTMAVTISIVGGRPAMVSGAAGATALVVAPLFASHGIDYLIAAVLVAGVMQIALSLAGAAKLMRFVPRSVMVGFVNALAILIFSAQLPELIDVPAVVYPFVAAGLLVMFLVPRRTQAIPAPLIVVAVLTTIAMVFDITMPTVGDRGELPNSLPSWFLPDVPISWETLKIIAPYSFGMALVGLLESLLTAKLVDDITDTHSDKTREAWGQGVANVVTACFGGLGGCAMIGQTMINVKASHGRTRISTFTCGVALLVLVVALGDIVGQIPMAALVAIMIAVSVTTFDWHSVRLRTLKTLPISATLIMVVTVATTLITHNLGYGVIVGVIAAMISFARRVSHFTQVERDLAADEMSVTYRVRGALFFASSNDLVTQFNYVEDPAEVIIDLSAAQIYDASTVESLDAIVLKYQRKDKAVSLIGLNEPSAQWHKLSGTLGTN